MKRREFIVLLGGVALMPPFPTVAEQPAKVFRLGWLSPNSDASPNGAGNEFLRAMREHGYIEGTNLIIDFRSTAGDADRYSPLAAELVALKPDCIVAIGVGATRAAKQATSAIPIVMGTADDDPVRQGLIASYAHPGGNVTGITNISADLAGTRLGLLATSFPDCRASRSCGSPFFQ